MVHVQIFNQRRSCPICLMKYIIQISYAEKSQTKPVWNNSLNLKMDYFLLAPTRIAFYVF